MSREPLSSRHRAAACHFALFPLLTAVWLPLWLRRSTSEEEEPFIHQHATGAAVYQGLALLSVGTLWLGLKLPALFLSPAGAGLMLLMLGVVAFCWVGMLLLGALALSFQAWNGDPFWAPMVSWLLGYDAPSEE